MGAQGACRAAAEQHVPPLSQVFAVLVGVGSRAALSPVSCRKPQMPEEDDEA